MTAAKQVGHRHARNARRESLRQGHQGQQEVAKPRLRRRWRRIHNRPTLEGPIAIEGVPSCAGVQNHWKSIPDQDVPLVGTLWDQAHVDRVETTWGILFLAPAVQRARLPWLQPERIEWQLGATKRKPGNETRGRAATAEGRKVVGRVGSRDVMVKGRDPRSLGSSRTGTGQEEREREAALRAKARLTSCVVATKSSVALREPKDARSAIISSNRSRGSPEEAPRKPRRPTLPHSAHSRLRHFAAHFPHNGHP